jgi:hypothetical protein
MRNEGQIAAFPKRNGLDPEPGPARRTPGNPSHCTSPHLFAAANNKKKVTATDETKRPGLLVRMLGFMTAQF